MRTISLAPVLVLLTASRLCARPAGDFVGLTPFRAFFGATRSSAAALRLLHDLGTPETGTTASLVVLKQSGEPHHEHPANR